MRMRWSIRQAIEDSIFAWLALPVAIVICAVIYSILVTNGLPTETSVAFPLGVMIVIFIAGHAYYQRPSLGPKTLSSLEIFQRAATSHPLMQEIASHLVLLILVLEIGIAVPLGVPFVPLLILRRMRVVEPKETTVVARKTGVLQSLLDYFFPRLRLEEETQVIWRKHWYVLLQKTAGHLVLLILVLEIGMAVALGLPLVSFLPRTSALVLCVTAASLLALFILYRYEDWRDDIYVLTDDRIIDMEKKPLFLREERREASLAMIQDVRYIIPGVAYNLLNVGMVIIETAAAEGEFTFDWVHDPRRVQEQIFARVDAYREREKRREQEAQAAQMQE